MVCILLFCFIQQKEIGRSALNILFSDLMLGLDVWSLNMTNVCTKYARCTKYQRKKINYHNNILHTDNPGFRESFDPYIIHSNSPHLYWAHDMIAWILNLPIPIFYLVFVLICLNWKKPFIKKIRIRKFKSRKNMWWARYRILRYLVSICSLS